jgi:hypothetical protein
MDVVYKKLIICEVRGYRSTMLDQQLLVETGNSGTRVCQYVHGVLLNRSLPQQLSIVVSSFGVYTPEYFYQLHSLENITHLCEVDCVLYCVSIFRLLV